MAKKRTREQQLINEVRERAHDAWQHDRENREDAHKDLRFLAGNQWPQEIRRSREQSNRPTLTINRLPQFVNQVVNDIRQNPPAIRTVPADGTATEEIAEIYTGLIRQIEYRSGAQHVYASAASHAVSCGIGHFRVKTDFIDDASFEQEILIERIAKPLSVLWDPASVMPDRSDAQWCVVTEMMPLAKFKAEYPNAKQQDIDIVRDATAESGLYWTNTDHIRLAEYWKKVPAKRRLALFEDGSTLDVTDLTDEQRAFLPDPVRERTADSFKVVHYLMTGAEILEGPNEWAGRFIPILPVIGSEIPLEVKTARYGLIRFARDPQQLYNYWRSAAAESIALAPKAPYLVTPNMIARHKSQWDAHNVTNRPYLMYDPDEDAPGARPIREQAPQPPQALVQESSIASDDMKATTGIFDASLGAQGNETSGRAILARQREGDVGTFHFQDNLNASLRHLGHILVDLIPRIYDTERQIRIIRPDDSQEFVPINQMMMSDSGEPVLFNDLSQGRFDVRVRIGPSYTTQRIEAASQMIELAQAIPQTGAVISDLLVKNLDWAGADEIAERLKRTIPPEIRGPDDEQDEQQQAAAQQAQQLQQTIQELQLKTAQLNAEKLEAEVAKLRAEVDNEEADVIKTRTEAAENMQEAEGHAIDNLIKQFEVFGEARS